MSSIFSTPYYNANIRKFVVSFGAIFSDLKIPRHDDNGNLVQTVNVPLAYGPKEKHFVRQEQDPSLETHVNNVLPKMGFEIAGYTYDTTRKTNRNNTIKCIKDGHLTSVYSPVPYNLDINLYVLSKGTEDGFAIVEQILPLFSPEYNLNIKMLEEMNIVDTVPVILNSVSVQDDYEGDFANRRLVTHTFNFTAKLNIYGQVKEGNVITQTNVNVSMNSLGLNDTTRIDTGNLATGATSGAWYTP